jgi:hypothetical protein
MARHFDAETLHFHPLIYLMMFQESGQPRALTVALLQTLAR